MRNAAATKTERGVPTCVSSDWTVGQAVPFFEVEAQVLLEHLVAQRSEMADPHG